MSSLEPCANLFCCAGSFLAAVLGLRARTPKMASVFNFWFPFKTNQKGVPSNKYTPNVLCRKSVNFVFLKKAFGHDSDLTFVSSGAHRLSSSFDEFSGRFAKRSAGRSGQRLQIGPRPSMPCKSGAHGDFIGSATLAFSFVQLSI